MAFKSFVDIQISPKNVNQGQDTMPTFVMAVMAVLILQIIISFTFQYATAIYPHLHIHVYLRCQNPFSRRVIRTIQSTKLKLNLHFHSYIILKK